MLHVATPATAATEAANASDSADTSKKLIFAPGEVPQYDTHAPARAAQFHLGMLSRSDLSPSPFTQFHSWFTAPALVGTIPETCTLSTASLPSGRISSRMVYLKELDEHGFVIYSNWGTSQKAKDFATNKWCSLVFWWKNMERQVRIEGKGERMTREESQLYFDTRARGSRLGAWASRQSQVLKPKEDDPNDDGRGQLEEWVKEEEEKWEGKEKIDVPEFWGGLRIVPEMVEFWQGRDSRLHDRFKYEKIVKEDGEEGWEISRLSP